MQSRWGENRQKQTRWNAQKHYRAVHGKKSPILGGKTCPSRLCYVPGGRERKTLYILKATTAPKDMTDSREPPEIVQVKKIKNKFQSIFPLKRVWDGSMLSGRGLVFPNGSITPPPHHTCLSDGFPMVLWGRHLIVAGTEEGGVLH